MHLINYINFIFPHLRRYPYLVNQVTNIIDTVVGSCIQFVNIKRGRIIKCFAGRTLITGFGIGGRMQAVYCFCKNTRTSCFTYTPGTAEKKSLRQLVIPDGVFKGSGNRNLSNYCTESYWTIFTRRYNKIIHKY